MLLAPDRVSEPLYRGDLDDLEEFVTVLEVDLDTSVDEPIEGN